MDIASFLYNNLFPYEFLTLLAAAFELTGVYCLGQKVRTGFLCNIIGGILWISYSLLSLSAFGLLGVCSVGLVLNTKGFRNWGKNNKAICPYCKTSFRVK